MLAELVENALVFSRSDRAVDIRGRHRPAQGAGEPGGYVLAIIDFGLGMPEADLAAANRRLAGAESFTVAPSKYLGHYVAGNLAARHGIRVHLQHSPGSGITATVALPANLLTIDGQGHAPGRTDRRPAGLPRPPHRRPRARRPASWPDPRPASWPDRPLAPPGRLTRGVRHAPRPASPSRLPRAISVPRASRRWLQKRRKRSSQASTDCIGVGSRE